METSASRIGHTPWPCAPLDRTRQTTKERTALPGVTLRAVTAGAAATAAAAAFAGAALASPVSFTSVPTPNHKAAGYSPASKYSPELRPIVQAQGSTPIENPIGFVSFYGYENDVPSADDPSVPQMVPTAADPGTEAQKTEPDKNTYLHFNGGQDGPDPN